MFACAPVASCADVGGMDPAATTTLKTLQGEEIVPGMFHVDVAPAIVSALLLAT
jgi:hypothetical protein